MLGFISSFSKTGDFKDGLTNLVAAFFGVVGIVNAALQAQAGMDHINWLQFLMFLGGAIVSHQTGKISNGTK